MKKALWGLAIIMIASIIVIACRKTDSVAKENVNPVFDVAASKEWWYGSFRKTPQYLDVDYTSVFAPSISDGINATKKYPNWKDGISYKTGALQFVELPLVYNNQVSIFPGSDRIDKNERIRIASATLNKLLIIKKPGNSIVLRTVSLIPSPEYAKQKNYDITGNTLQKPDPHFSGWLVVKDWKETIINYWQIEDGRKVRRMELKEKSKEKERNENGLITDQEVCYFVQVAKTNRLCVGYFITGDQPPTDEDCTQWYEYEYYEYEWDCHDEGTGGEGPTGGCGIGISDEQCACVLYGIGCDGGGEWEEPTPPEIINDVQDPCIRDMVNDAISLDCKNKITEFINTAFNTNEHFHLVFYDRPLGTIVGEDGNSVCRALADPTQTKVTIELNNSPNTLNGASREYIAITIFHEILHAWIDYRSSGPIDELESHEQMANTTNLGLMADALQEMYPNMSRQDAIDLAWGGLQSTSAWAALSQADKNRINLTNAQYKNNSKGTPCTP